MSNKGDVFANATLCTHNMSVDLNTGNHTSVTTVSYSDDDIFIHPHWQSFEPLSLNTNFAFGVIASIAGLLAIVGNLTVISLFYR